MHKAFDKAFDKAPYLQSDLNIYTLQKFHIGALYFMMLVAAAAFGYVFLLQLFFVLALSTITVWIYSFFNKSFFFSTRQWRIAIFTYVLCLSPSISIVHNLVGVVFMIGFGVLVLSTNNRPIINPVLLGVLGANFFNYTYIEHPNISMPYLMHMLNEGDLTKAFVEANNILAYNREYAAIHGTDTHLDRFYQFMFSKKVLWYSTGSELALAISFVYLSATKVIAFFPPLIYTGFYLFFNWLLGNFFTGGVVDNAMIFCAIFILPFTLPSNIGGMVLSPVLSALAAALLNDRQYMSMNFIFALIITNAAAALLENITKKRVLGAEKTPVFNYKLEYNKVFNLRLIMGASLIAFSMLLGNTMFIHNVFDRESEYKRYVIQSFFNEDIVSRKGDDIYYIRDKNIDTYIMYNKQSIDRSCATTLLVVKNNLIDDVKILDITTAHSYTNDFSWLNGYIGRDVNDITNFDTDINTNQSITKVVIDSLNKNKNNYKNFIKGGGDAE